MEWTKPSKPFVEERGQFIRSVASHAEASALARQERMKRIIRQVRQGTPLASTSRANGERSGSDSTETFKNPRVLKHAFKRQRLLVPKRCFSCGAKIHFRERSSFCSVCKIIVHTTCEDFLPDPCVPVAYKRKQRGEPETTTDYDVSDALSFGSPPEREQSRERLEPSRLKRRPSFDKKQVWSSTTTLASDVDLDESDWMS